MNPKQFLQLGGVILVLLGIIGFLKPDLAGDFLNFDAPENWAHLLLGVVALVLAPLPLGSLKKWVVVLVGLTSIAFAVLGFMVRGNPSPNFYGVSNLENPADNVLHLVVGVWAMLAAFNKNSSMS
jgi:hypothetical protein